MILDIGRVIADRYEITEKIGSGGMSIVYKALDRKLSRPVSLKVLREEYSVDDEFRKRFIREARSVASLNHQNIVNVYDVGQEDEINFIVMEYIAGMTLKELINKRAPFADQEALGVAIQMAAALIHAHNSNIIHRDIKPQNVIVTGKGVIKVADFGIARKADSSSATLGGTTLGSVHYFSPEQARGVKASPESDLYSLGIVMYEMFTGELPFDADTAVSVALMQINEPLPDIYEYNPNINPKVKMIINKLVEKEPAYRYQSADVLLRDLRAIIADPAAKLSFEGEVLRAPRPPERSSADKRERPDPADFYEEDDLDYDRDEDRRDDYDEDYEDDYEDGYVRERDSRFRSMEEDDDYDYEPPKSKHKSIHQKGSRPPAKNPGYSSYAKPKHKGDKSDRVVVVAGVAVALVLVALVAVLLLPPLMRTFLPESGPVMVTLPEMEGVNFETLRAELLSLGVYLDKLEEGYHETIPAGAVVAATFESGASVERGIVVEVVVSLGQFMVEIPSFLDMEDLAAFELRNQQQLPIELISVHEFNPRPSGTIFDQSPPAGTIVAAGSEVTIYISMGQELTRFPMPQLVGTTLSSALNELERLGLRTGSVTPRHDASAPLNQVLHQNITAGNDVFAGMSVNLIISDGPEPDPDENDDDTENGENGPAATPFPDITPLPEGTPGPQATPNITPMPLFTPTPSPPPTPSPVPTPSPTPSPVPESTPPPNIIPEFTPTPGLHYLPTPSPPVVPPSVQHFSVVVTRENFGDRLTAEVSIFVNDTQVQSRNLHVSQLPHEFRVSATNDATIQIRVDNLLISRRPASDFPLAQ